MIGHAMMYGIPGATMPPLVILEIRTYRLQPGTADAFHRAMSVEALPLLARAGIDVVYCGPSLPKDDHAHYILIRAFDNLDARADVETRFYGSDEWRQGPRERVLAAIDSYHTIVLAVTARAVEALRAGVDQRRTSEL
jgi:hypothetical protein